MFNINHRNWILKIGQTEKYTTHFCFKSEKKVIILLIFVLYIWRNLKKIKLMEYYYSFQQKKMCVLPEYQNIFLFKQGLIVLTWSNLFHRATLLILLLLLFLCNLGRFRSHNSSRHAECLNPSAPKIWILWKFQKVCDSEQTKLYESVSAIHWCLKSQSCILLISTALEICFFKL